MRVIKHKRNNPYKLNKFDLVEIDIRKYLGRIYVSHSEGDICIATLDDYLNIAKKKKVGLVAIDMKSKGLEQYAITMLEKYNIPGFVFDLNNYQIDLKYNHTNRVPLMLNEENPFLESFEPKKWIWLHTNNKDLDFLISQYEEIRKKWEEKSICFSGVNKLKKKELKDFMSLDDENAYLCTDNWREFIN